MVEGGAVKADKTEFTECWRTVWRTPYIMQLALTAGIGGLLFGYDTGNISGALLYIRDDFEEVDKKTWLQETIVSMTVAGAIIGAGFGGWLNDSFGRKKSILLADVVFLKGAIVMAVAPAPWVIIIGRIMVGLGVGMASMTAPLYISEASPARIRGALVSTNGLLITSGQFLAYVVNYALSSVKSQWRWMLGLAAVPAGLQIVLMLMLPESPRWLYRKNKVDEARAILERIYSADEVEDEINALEISIANEKALEASIGDTLGAKLKGALSNVVVRRGLYAGIACQVTQQFVGINTVMYYAPTIVQFAGFASKKTALALSLITSGINALGSLISMAFVDRYGRRRLMMISLVGIITCLIATAVTFLEASHHAPGISPMENRHFGANATCSDFMAAGDSYKWDCMSCVEAKCGFCSNAVNKYQPGACLANTKQLGRDCRGEDRTWFEKGCPSEIGFLAVIFLGLYIISYSPGMGTVPWIVNSEIYPLRYRGLGGGIAAVANWVSNLIVSQTFLTIQESLGSFGAFMLFAGFSCVGLVAIFLLVPETKGLRFEEIEKVLEKGYRPVTLKSKAKNAGGFSV
ncbi:Inositol transporter 4 [Tripterygium wilfordii]|uniref:Inositol transporter 4 n=1 Tax=Tripterygium wilfordii TaxID=458696 RepID=A0A7J7C401_TRIWF|nr:inositol transporter 4-like [Tripterygium wilfordii]XP_038690183.1 inositol transporter 4-like [Tripterygium wilfordii]XP_038690185.1 inositol transporter 4-like [Tripterygium wilfordii]KAF5728853.1 Inositol transporter 4 [Tripterygium wilfordii]